MAVSDSSLVMYVLYTPLSDSNIAVHVQHQWLGCYNTSSHVAINTDSHPSPSWRSVAVSDMILMYISFSQTTTSGRPASVSRQMTTFVWYASLWVCKLEKSEHHYVCSLCISARTQGANMQTQRRHHLVARNRWSLVCVRSNLKFRGN